MSEPRVGNLDEAGAKVLAEMADQMGWENMPKWMYDEVMEKSGRNKENLEKQTL